MADTPTGVTPSRGRGRRGRGGSFLKRNKLAVIGGGAVGAFLLISHKGGQTTAGSTNQSAAGQQLQAYQQGVQDASGLLGQSTGASGGGGDFSTGGASSGASDPGSASGGGGGGAPGDTPTPSDTGAPLAVGNAPVGPINVTVNTPAGKATPAAKKGGAKKAGSAAKSAASALSKAKPTTKARSAPSQKGGGTKKAAAPKPKQAAHGKPAPATKAGTHPATKNKTPAGKKKKSPAQVESVFGAGAGVVIGGREFPGAQSHRMGAPMRASDGTIMRRVMVDYGGRTEQHLMLGDGSEWLDNAPGVNPPSRGVPMLMRRSDAR